MKDHDHSDSGEGGSPPNRDLQPRKRRRLSGVSRKALEDLVLLLSLFTSEVLTTGDTRGSAGTLRANLANWVKVYL